MYNEIEECSKELAVVSSKVRLTPGEILGRPNAQPFSQPLRPHVLGQNVLSARG